MGGKPVHAQDKRMINARFTTHLARDAKAKASVWRERSRGSRAVGPWGWGDGGEGASGVV